MKYTRKLSFLILLNFIAFVAKPQDVGKLSLKEIEDTLSVLMKSIYSDNTNLIKEEANNKFQSLLRISLYKDGSFDYPFDSLKHIGKIKSEDGKIRIFTWNLPQSGGYQKYFGFLMYKKGKNNSQIFELNDSRKEISEPVNEILSAKKWLGNLYYSIVEETYKGQAYYILLGLDFNNLFSSKKVIDVLTFNKNSEPVFGSNIFKVGDAILKRVIFEFSARATMSLRYINESKTIVFDHLSPSRPDFTDNYQFYGPDFTYDGFRFEKGFWVYVRNLDLRNPRREPVKPRESPEKLPDPGFLYKSKGGVPIKHDK
jgi:hypothetical protein